MQIILMQRVAKLGQMGELVKVRDGYARNYLLPQGKALRATKANIERFETERVHLEAHNLERKGEAEKVAETMDGTRLIVVRQAAETGQLYGSVSPRDIADDLSAQGFEVSRNQINLNNPIKAIGIHSVEVNLHPEVQISVSVNVARSTDEAERQAAGEDLTQRDERFQFEPEPDDEDEDETETSEDSSEETAEAEADPEV